MNEAFIAALRTFPGWARLTEGQLEALYLMVVDNANVPEVGRRQGVSPSATSNKVILTARTLGFDSAHNMRYALTVAYGKALARQDGLEGLVGEIGAWQAETFPHATPASSVVHMRHEVSELQQDPTSGEEQADVMFMVIQAARLSGNNLVAEVRRKFIANKTREWQQPDQDGVTEHVR